LVRSSKVERSRSAMMSKISGEMRVGVMRRKIQVLLILLVVGMVLAGCGNSGSASDVSIPGKEPVSMETKELTVSAAASLKKCMTEIEKVYEEENTGINLTFNYASSGSLQKQIEQGAPVDIFLSAGKPQMDALEEKNLLTAGTRIDFLTNDIVLIVPEKNKSITAFQDLLKVKQMSIGTPESVPAGKYAKEVLTHMNLWDSLETDLVLAKDVTQVLTYVETENVEAGMVYGSDAHESKKIRVVAIAPEDSHSPIIYPGAVVASTKYVDEAKDFMQFLSRPEAQDIFIQYGFKGQ